MLYKCLLNECSIQSQKVKGEIVTHVIYFTVWTTRSAGARLPSQIQEARSGLARDSVKTVILCTDNYCLQMYFIKICYCVQNVANASCNFKYFASFIDFITYTMYNFSIISNSSCNHISYLYLLKQTKICYMNHSPVSNQVRCYFAAATEKSPSNTHLCNILQQHPFSVTIFSCGEPNISTYCEVK